MTYTGPDLRGLMAKNLEKHERLARTGEPGMGALTVDCRRCGKTFVVAGRGRPPRYCSEKCRWTAGKEGLAHAHRGSRPHRTVCGLPAIEERYGWPTLVRCDVCQAAVVGEPTEGESRELWGK